MLNLAARTLRWGAGVKSSSSLSVCSGGPLVAVLFDVGGGSAIADAASVCKRCRSAEWARYDGRRKCVGVGAGGALCVGGRDEELVTVGCIVEERLRGRVRVAGGSHTRMTRGSNGLAAAVIEARRS